MGILGINSVLEDEKERFLRLSMMKGGSYYPVGIMDKFFKPKVYHEKVKSVFKRFEKSLE